MSDPGPAPASMDVLSYTSNSPIPAWATHIVDTIKAGDLDHARHLFTQAAAETSVDDAVFAVGAAVEPGPGVISVGEAPQVFGNPFRDGWAWRCGTCLHAFRNGGRLPAAGVNYKTHRGAFNAAHRHSDEDHASSVPINDSLSKVVYGLIED